MDNPEQQTQSTRGQFFAMCTQSIRNIVNAGGKAEDVIGYMILARHTPGRGNNRYRASTAGANAIAGRAGITHGQAKKVLAWLQNHNFIDKPIPGADDKTKKKQYRWVLSELDDESLVYLSHSLFDGVGQGKNCPPMSRIISQTPLPTDICLPVRHARLDSIMVLIHLYQHHDIAAFGGVDPRAGVFRKWEHTDPQPLIDEWDGPIVVQEIKGADQAMFTRFAEDALFYIKDPELRNKRFWNAFNNLHRLGFLYEVLEIWDANPLEDIHAEPLYPLYIFDKHARASEPYLSKTIHKAFIDTGHVYGMEVPEFFEDIKFHRPSGEIQFRYAVPINGGYPLSVYRLRFRPKTRDTAIGIDRENTRAEGWEDTINGITDSEIENGI